MADIRLVKIGDIVTTNASSYSSKDHWEYVNYLDTGNITQNVIDSIQRIDLTQEKLPSRAKRKVKENSIVYSTVRPNQLHYGIIRNQPENFLVSTGFTVIDVDERQAIAEYVYYFLTQKEIVESLQAIGEQSVSTYPSIKPSDIEDIEIPLPSLYIQNKIVGILKSLDAKIKTNSDINNNLASQAEAIYKAYFSPKIATDVGQSRTLDEFCEIFTGKKNSNAAITDGKYKFFTCSPDPLLIDSFIYDGDAIIVSGNGAYTGRTRFYSGRFDLYQRTYACTLKNQYPVDYIFPLYWFVRLELSKKIMGGTRGSAIPYIVMNDLAKFEFAFEQEVFEKYAPIFRTITTTIQSNEEENETLAQTRESLLSKLMSGELDVSEVEI